MRDLAPSLTDLLADVVVVADPLELASASEPWLFTKVVLTESDREVEVDVDRFVALVGSWGWIADLPGEQRVAVLGAVRELVGAQATVTVRHHTEVCAARTIDG